MPDETKPQAAADDKPAPFKPGEVLGEINGVPFKMGDKLAESKEPGTLEEHHAALVARLDVTLVKPKRVVRGRAFPEVKTPAKLPSLKCAIAHRVLHGMSPAEVKAMRAAFEAAKVESKHPDAFDMWALKQIETALDGVPDVPAAQMHLAEHAHAGKVGEHRKRALASLSPS